MKKLLTVMITLILSTAYAQTPINYKALIKDASGNPIANDLVQVQFSIRTSTDVANEVYNETHTPTTDANGLVMLNIGAGTANTGNFADIDWASSDHYLNVQVNPGGGYVDLGTTQFMAVPYALYAKTSGTSTTGLEALDEGNGIGWRYIGRNANRYGNIGSNATDLSFSNSGSTRGATGNHAFTSGLNTTASGSNSTAMGDETTASGFNSTAMGDETTASGTNSIAMGILTTASGFSSTAMGAGSTASGDRSTAMGLSTTASGTESTAMGGYTVASGLYSTAMGFFTTASGNRSIAMGSNTTAPSLAETVIGAYNTDYTTTPFSWNTNDRLFVIGNGTSSSNKSNALTVFKNGNATLAGSLTQNSDRRLKQDINTINYGLNEVLKLNPVSYHWKKYSDQPKSLGLIAQEVQPIINEVVTVQDNPEKTLGVSYIELIPVLIKAIQEQQAIITNLKSAVGSKQLVVSKLETMVNTQQNDISELKSLVNELLHDNDKVEKE